MWADVLYVGQPNGCHGISPAMPKKEKKKIGDNIRNTVGHKCKCHNKCLILLAVLTIKLSMISRRNDLGNVVGNYFSLLLFMFISFS